MQQLALEILLQKAGQREADIDLVFSGDLLNQCISSSFALRNTGLPALGLYGACSTMAESLLLGSLAVSGEFANQVGGHDLLPFWPPRSGSTAIPWATAGSAPPPPSGR